MIAQDLPALDFVLTPAEQRQAEQIKDELDAHRRRLNEKEQRSRAVAGVEESKAA